LADHGDSHIDLKACADDGPIDWRDMDLAIRSSRKTWPEAEIEELLPITRYPVCSPDLLRDRRPLLCAESLLSLPLLALAGRNDAWPAWFKCLGIARPKAVVAFDDPHLLYEAAASGLGVAIGEDVLLEPHLDGDRLILSPRLAVALGESYVVCRPRRALDPSVGRFRDWLVNAATQWSQARPVLGGSAIASV
jgi:LysR family transcriptional regulator, glycine cleavage system transcriptional activator